MIKTAFYSNVLIKNFNQMIKKIPYNKKRKCQANIKKYVVFYWNIKRNWYTINTNKERIAIGDVNLNIYISYKWFLLMIISKTRQLKI